MNRQHASIRQSALLTVTTHALLQIANLSHCWVLAASAQQIAEVVELDTAIAALVEQRESLLVVGRSLSVVLIRSHDYDCVWFMMMMDASFDKFAASRRAVCA